MQCIYPLTEMVGKPAKEITLWDAVCVCLDRLPDHAQETPFEMKASRYDQKISFEDIEDSKERSLMEAEMEVIRKDITLVRPVAKREKATEFVQALVSKMIRNQHYHSYYREKYQLENWRKNSTRDNPYVIRLCIGRDAARWSNQQTSMVTPACCRLDIWKSDVIK